MTKESITSISLVQPALRLAYAAIAAIAILSAAVSYPERGFPIPESILFALCALAACYEERWSFDRDSSVLTFSHGILFCARKKKYPFGEIAGIGVDTFDKGFRKTGYTRVSVVLVNGDELVIDSMPTKKAASLIGKANELERLFRERSGSFQA